MTDAAIRSNTEPSRRPRAEERVAYILRRRNLIPATRIVQQGMRIMATRRDRATTATVHLGGQGTFLVKLGTRSASNWNRREITCYQAVQSLSPGIAPYLAHSDPDRGILITELLDPATTLHDFMGRNPLDDPAVLDGLANVLARLHQGNVDDTHLPPARPWMLARDSGGLHEQLHHLLPNPAARAAVMACINRAQATWRETCLIHGDLKWDNCLLQSGPDGTVQIRLVDWELAGLGDPAWDVATAVQEYLQLAQLPASPDNKPLASLPENEACRAAVHLFSAYTRATGTSGSANTDFLKRCSLYTGIRLVQTTLELQSMESPDGTRSQVALAMALRVCQTPKWLETLLRDGPRIGTGSV